MQGGETRPEDEIYGYSFPKVERKFSVQLLGKGPKE